jgi:DNA-binding Lrp family transcriptional regulator
MLLDRAILALLQEDAQLTNRAIAARVSSNEATVRRRVDRLIAAGLVRIVTVVSSFALGYQVVAILGLRIARSYQRQIEEVRFVGLAPGRD